MEHYTRTIEWSTEDFEMQAETRGGEDWKDVYDSSKFKEALDEMIGHHDALIGITWDTVDYYLDEFCRKNDDEIINDEEEPKAIITDEDAIRVIMKIHNNPIDNEKLYMVSGLKSYSINDIINEIRNKTEFGNRIVDNLKTLSKIKGYNL